MARILHAICGDSGAGSLAEGLPWSLEDLVTFRDLLSCGPLIAFSDLDQWRSLRLGFWKRLESGEPITPEEEEWARKDILDNPHRLAEADEVILWVGMGLGDQLLLAWLPQLLRRVGADVERLKVVQFERHPSGNPLPTLGVLDAAQYRNAPPARAITEAELNALDEAWSAVTSPDPRDLLSFLANPSPRMPILTAALRNVLSRYPDVHSGVNRAEARLLAHTRDHGPSAAGAIGHAMVDSWHASDPEGDLWLFWRLQRLADPALPHPAVTMTGTRTEMRGTEVRLTGMGEHFANAERNFVELNGIDDWVCGVHLDSNAGNVWFHEGDTLVRG